MTFNDWLMQPDTLARIAWIALMVFAFCMGSLHGELQERKR